MSEICAQAEYLQDTGSRLQASETLAQTDYLQDTGPHAGLSFRPAAVRLDGLQNVLRVGWRLARPGRVRVVFGPPLRLKGDDYEAAAKQVEDAVKSL